MDIPHFADEMRRQLQADGYQVHHGHQEDGPELAGAFWFTWTKPGMADAQVGPTLGGEWAAWASALAHRLVQSAIALHCSPEPWPAMGSFHAASLPPSAFDADVLAARHGLTREAAMQQVEKLRRQSVYMNERYR